MRKIVFLCLWVTAFVLISCEGSDVYRGKWNATNAEGAKSEIEFTADQMSIKNDDGDSGVWEYSQRSINIENRKSTYGIQLENGLTYSIIFPVKDNPERGAIADQNNQIIFIIGRNDFYSYDDVFGIKLKPATN